MRTFKILIGLIVLEAVLLVIMLMVAMAINWRAVESKRAAAVEIGAGWREVGMRVQDAVFWRHQYVQSVWPNQGVEDQSLPLDLGRWNNGTLELVNTNGAGFMWDGTNLRATFRLNYHSRGSNLPAWTK